MTLFRAEKRAVTYADVWGSGDDVTGATSMSGEPVNFATVTGLDAVAGCVGLMSDIVSMVPFHAYRDVGGVAQRLSSQPLVITSPSTNVWPTAWKAQAVVSVMLWGNLYLLVVATDHLGYPTQIEVLDPAQVTCIERPPSGAPQWFLAGRPIDAGRIIHVPGRYVRPGSILGIAPLERHKDTYGLALAARRYGAEWFRDGAHHDGVVSSDKEINETQAKTIKARVIAAVRKRREPLVLGAGLKWEKTSGNPSESQMVEVEAQIVGRVARIMGVPVEMVGGAAAGSSITYANREQRAVDLLTYNVDPHLVRLEELYTRCLPRPQYAKAARGALLRTDLLTRYRAHDIAIRGGFATPNERRRLEDDPPLPDGFGDQPLWPPYATTIQPQSDDGGQP